MLKIRLKTNKHNAVWLVEPKVSIGRASDNDFVVDDSSIAANHVVIEVKHENLKLVNVSGSKQVTVNGRIIDQNTELKPADELVLGNVQLEIIDPKQEQRPAAAPAPETAADSGTTGWALKSNHTALSNRVFPIKAETVIGRSNDCDITLAAAHLSRRHVKLSIQEGGLLYVKDLGSANGTYLNGKRVVGEERVRRGDELRFDTLSFGVIGPAQDMDKTTVRAIPTIKPSSTPASTKPSPQPASAQNSTPQQKVTRASQPGSQARPNPAPSQAPSQADAGGSNSTLIWVGGIVVVIALGVGIAFVAGVF